MRRRLPSIPGARPVPFGHLGDGNIHYNVLQPENADKADYLKHWDAMNAAIFAVVKNYGGSISAEHGVGVVKRDLLPSVKDPVALELMKSLKRMLDPKGILNPGKVLARDPEPTSPLDSRPAVADQHLAADIIRLRNAEQIDGAGRLFRRAARPSGMVGVYGVRACARRGRPCSVRL